jgi:hypothetical protein
MANKKIFADLTALTTAAADDVLPIVDDTTGTPTTKKISVSNLMAQAPVQTSDISGFATTVSLGNHESLTSSVHGISAFGATLVDDADAATARTTLGLGSAATSASTDFSSAFYSTVSETTTARTLSNSDNGKVIVCTNAATITITIPNSLTAGFSCKLVQGGAGIVGVTAAAGTTLSVIGGKNHTSNQYQVVDLINYGTELYVLDSVGLQVDPSAFNGNTYSVNLDGTDDMVTCGNIAAINSASNVSISCWVNADTFPHSSFNSLWGGGRTGGDATGRFWLTANSGRFNIYNGSTQNFSFSTTVSTSTWYNVVTVISLSNNFTLYVNGSQVGSGVTSFTSLTSESGNNFQIGGNPTYDPYYWDGYIDEFAVFNSALSASQVTNIYKGESDGGSGGTNGTVGDLSTFSPTVWLRMGDIVNGQGTTVTNNGSTSTTNNGTLTNGAAFSTTVP